MCLSVFVPRTTNRMRHVNFAENIHERWRHSWLCAFFSRRISFLRNMHWSRQAVFTADAYVLPAHWQRKGTVTHTRQINLIDCFSSAVLIGHLISVYIGTEIEK